MSKIEIIKDILEAREPKLLNDDENQYRQGSVLVPIFRENGDYKILFTKRTHKVEKHKGQISFPGGAVDPEDLSLEDTAPRETNQELGILKEDVQILECARKNNVDLIIIGREGKSTWGTHLFGNITERVARKAECPVLIVPGHRKPGKSRATVVLYPPVINYSEDEIPTLNYRRFINGSHQTIFSNQRPVCQTFWY